MFFKPKPNVPPGEKARLEYYLQQIGETIGMDRFQLPVLDRDVVLGWSSSGKTPQEMLHAIGAHLQHEVSGVGFELDPQQLQQCGGGG